jgi:hypothetical protein
MVITNARGSILVRLFIPSALLICCPGAASLAHEPSTSRKSATVLELIGQLTSTSESARASAERQLLQREDAIPVLRNLQNGTNADLAKKAEGLLAIWNSRLRKRLIERAADYARAGRVDNMVEALVAAGPTKDDDAVWRVAQGFAWRIVDGSRRQFPNGGGPNLEDLPSRDWTVFEKKFKPSLILGPKPQTLGVSRQRRERALVCAESLHANMRCTLTYFITTGDIRLLSKTNNPMSLGGTFVFCGGSIGEIDSFSNSVVVCQSSLNVDRHISGAIVIARGSVECGKLANSIVISGGPIRVKESRGAETSTLKSDATSFLGFIEFFTPEHVGLQLEERAGSVWITQVTERSPMSVAGVRRGDILRAVNGAEANPLIRFGDSCSAPAFTTTARFE